MTPDQFDALVTRLDARAKAHPVAYRAAVIALAAAGYAYLGAILLGCAAAIAACCALLYWRVNAGTMKLLLMVGAGAGAIAWQVLRSLVVRFAQPEGLPISRAEHPRLFEIVDGIRMQLGAPKLHAVLLTGELNAALAQRPRLGILGWYRNTMVLGLPLLRALSVDQMRSVIAHELGHLRGAHGSMGAWVYRVRASWMRLFEGLRKQGRGGVVVMPFLRRYIPTFNAWTFVLARQQELQADESAVRVAGAEASAEALVRVNVISRHADERFWPQFSRASNREPEPPAGFLDRLAQAMHDVPVQDAQRWLREARNEATDNADTHPAMRDRLAAMGQPAAAERVPQPPAETAAQAWLGAQETALAAQLDAQWVKGVRAGWDEFRAARKEEEERRALLEEKRAGGGATADELVDLAEIVAEHDGAAAAAPLLEEALAKEPAHATALFRLGRHLLKEDDERGAALLEKVMGIDQDATVIVQSQLRVFWDRRGRRDAVKEADRAAAERAELERLAAEERQSVSPKKPLAPHDLVADAVENVRRAIASVPEVALADLARVEVQHLPERRFYVLAVKLGTPWWKFRTQDQVQKTLQQLADAVPVPGHLLVVNAKLQAKVAKKAAAQSGARVFERA